MISGWEGETGTDPPPQKEPIPWHPDLNIQPLELKNNFFPLSLLLGLGNFVVAGKE